MLLDPVKLGPRTAPNRVLFGPHETNLARGRALSERHVAYYERRAAGGAGVVVCEEASVHPSDWPYERAPLASACADGWAGVAAACRPHGALVLAGLGHAGGQGSSAYSQAPLWAPSRVPEVNTREVPKWMEDDDIEAVVDGFGAAARLAAESGLDGVEVNAGQHSLVRQFLSGLTNHRGDEWGTDRTKFLRDALGAARRAVGSDRLVGLRLSCDELAPWAGVTPEMAAVIAADVAPLVDYLVVVRGSIFTVGATRPDMHTEPGFNAALCRSIRDAITLASRGADGTSFGAPAVVLQGSVVDPDQAEWAISNGVCDVVEMTRAQIADADLVAKVRAGVPERFRPCLLCNQTCQVRDARNPLVTCVVDPRSGHETEDPPVDPSSEQRAAVSSDSPVDPATEPDRAGSWVPQPPTARPIRDVVVVGGGPAGLETARVAAERGHRVRLVEQVGYLGGSVPAAAVARGRERLAVSVEWLAAECRRLGVDITLNAEADAEAVGRWQAEGAVVVLATGSRKGDRPYEIGPGAAGRVRSARKVLSKRYDAQRGGDAGGGRLHESGEGPVVVLDPIGGPIGVSVAETFAADGRAVHLVTQDHIAGNELARTGDLAPANTRLQQVGVTIERRSLPRRIERRDRIGTHGDSGDARRSPDDDGPAEGATGATLDVVMEDRFTGQERKVGAALVVDAGYRLPDTSLYEATGSTLIRVGDAVAPRTIHEAILEARRAVLAIEARHR